MNTVAGSRLQFSYMLIFTFSSLKLVIISSVSHCGTEKNWSDCLLVQCMKQNNSKSHVATSEVLFPSQSLFCSSPSRSIRIYTTALALFVQAMLGAVVKLLVLSPQHSL